ncbi:hypothetical protein MKK64_19130 [Methylobacterium sp. E-025]|uniref:hypothetical protein n=1 Tax=Methylobacterium sp. E-025 TaxID=2836561 RepID=UPI001FBAA0CE|nr:hypothetical protein [Methylobacterium sp. E-025]MCJ2113293.1 hypothetical protein [Methylobacterium sp. E-025]
MSRTAGDIIEIGRDLIVIRTSMPGTFLEWIEAEFGMGQATAYRFIQAAENMGDRLITEISLPATVLYALASPSTPDSIRDEVMQSVEAGETVPCAGCAWMGTSAVTTLARSARMNQASH